MNAVRPPAVAGAFYPGDPRVLARTVDALLAEAPPWQGPPPKAVIVPHAGYVYSGPVAATAYRAIEAGRDRYRRVVLVGPSHRVPFAGVAIPSVDAFATPLGVVPLDRPVLDRLARLPGVQVSDAPHALEHSLEVQLPFLQRVLGDFTLVPIAVGEVGAEEMADLFEAVWDGDETLIVVSSDLSHYLPYDAARVVDARTAAAIEQNAWEALDYESACGRMGVRGLLEWARRHGKHLKTLDLRNSGDTAGSPDSVVGYGAFALT
ncbi:MAG: AmmeMemoRadiSam system protein B [Deltaproteobacteria bacterium]|nr:MAG: AmmeMemoRadiSam system protein B [Deltaproteobacteria bacterium]